MKPQDYYNHVDEDFADYHGYTQRHKRAVDYVNSKPGISPKLVKIAIASVCVAGLIVLIGKIFG